MLKVFLIFNILLAINLSAICQSCPPYPEGPKTSIPTFLRLPHWSPPQGLSNSDTANPVVNYIIYYAGIDAFTKQLRVRSGTVILIR